MRNVITKDMMTMSKVLMMAVMVALLAAFVVLLLKKWGVTEWMQVHGDSVSSRLFSCDFCMCFWASVMITCVSTVFVDGAWMMAVPFLSTPIARYLQ